MLLLLMCCDSRRLVYILDDNYTGICAIFLVDHISDLETAVISNGLSTMLKSDQSKTFSFQSKLEKAEIQIVENGSDAQDQERHVFKLLQSTFYDKCVKGKTEVITFFIGTQQEFELWESTQIVELNTLKMNSGLDWCGFLKKHSNSAGH